MSELLRVKFPLVIRPYSDSNTSALVNFTKALLHNKKNSCTFVTPKTQRIMNIEINNLPVWYGGGMRKHLNALCGVGHLNYTGFIIPKHKVL